MLVSATKLEIFDIILGRSTTLSITTSMDTWLTNSPTRIVGVRKRKVPPSYGRDDRRRKRILERTDQQPCSTSSRAFNLRQKVTQSHHGSNLSTRLPEPQNRCSQLERLPTEILHRIFCEASDPALSLASLPLTRVFNSMHLQLQYVRTCTNPSKVFAMRFFTERFLKAYEARYGILNASGCIIPVRFSARPWPAHHLNVIRMLAERGASVQNEIEAHRENLVQAIAHYRGAELLSVLSVVPDFKAHHLAVRKAIRAARSEKEGLELCKKLVDCGADISNSEIWKAALGRKEDGFVQFLIEHGAPPVEVLGELGGRQHS